MQDSGNESENDWFVSWFDDPHYHRLYAHRSQEEADALIANLHNRLAWTPGRIIDMGCGKGRHAAAAAKVGTSGEGGHQVLGVDLSPASIEAARKNFSSVPRLQFMEGDMRNFSLEQAGDVAPFDIALSLFTSFGYFDDAKDNARVIANFHRLLAPGGILVLDFLNTTLAKAHMITQERIQRDDITFEVKRWFSAEPSPGHFYKQIKWEGGEQTERVQALGFGDLTGLLKDGGFEILHTFGDYKLSPYAADVSPRCLLVSKRL